MDRERIEKLQAQVAEISAELESLKAKAEPEWVPFPGEFVLCRNYEGDQWELDRFTGHITDPLGWHCERAAWSYIQPIKNPNVIQLRPHKAGDPMPCEGGQKVLVRYTQTMGIPHATGDARDRNWNQVTAWAPLPKVPV